MTDEPNLACAAAHLVAVVFGFRCERGQLAAQFDYVAIAVFAAFVMIGTGTISYFLARRQTAPLVQLTEFANSLAKGNLKSRILRPQSDETGSLALSFNAMADSISTLLAEQDSKKGPRHRGVTDRTTLHKGSGVIDPERAVKEMEAHQLKPAAFEQVMRLNALNVFKL